MYEVDDQDRVRRLDDLPDSEAGAPMPLLLANDDRLVLAYFVSVAFANQHERVSGGGRREHDGELMAVVAFSCNAHMFGPPNDEALHGHPLAKRGLGYYGAYEVENSSWIRRQERMNSVHPGHDPSRFKSLRHLILTFHDSTFECVCDGFEVRLSRGTPTSIIPTMAALL